MKFEEILFNLFKKSSIFFIRSLSKDNKSLLSRIEKKIIEKNI